MSSMKKQMIDEVLDSAVRVEVLFHDGVQLMGYTTELSNDTQFVLETLIDAFSSLREAFYYDDVNIIMPLNTDCHDRRIFPKDTTPDPQLPLEL